MTIILYLSTTTLSTNGFTKYQLPTPYGFKDAARIKFYRARSLQQGQRSNQGQTMMLHTYNPKPRSHHDVAYLQPQTNVAIKYQHLSPGCLSQPFQQV